MFYRQPAWHRPLQSLQGLKAWLKDQLVDCIPNGHILILAGTVLVAGIMLLGLISFIQSTSQVESTTLDMMQAVQTPSDWTEFGADSNPLLQNVLTGGFVLMGMITLGAILVCLDRTREKMLD